MKHTSMQKPITAWRNTHVKLLALTVLTMFLLTGCLFNRFIKVENCIPSIELYSTEENPIFLIPYNIEPIWSHYKIAADEYYLCTIDCLDVRDEFNPDFIPILTGEAVRLDGFGIIMHVIFNGVSVMLRGKINNQTVWVHGARTRDFSSPLNESALKKIGVIDEDDGFVSQWRCTK